MSNEQVLFGNELQYIEVNEDDSGINKKVSLIDENNETISFDTLYNIYLKMVDTKKDEMAKIVSIGRGLGMGRDSTIFMVGWVFKAILTSIEKTKGKINIKINDEVLTANEIKKQQIDSLEKYIELIKNDVVESKDVSVGKVKAFD